MRPLSNSTLTCITRRTLTLTVLTIALLSALTLHTQTPQQVFDTTYVFETEEVQLWSFGLHPGTSFENWNVEMSGLPGVPSCCPEYRVGSGSELSIRMESSKRLREGLRLTGSIGYAIVRGTFEAIEEEFLDNGHVGEAGEILHELRVRTGELFLAPTIEYSPLPNLWVGLGPNVRLALSGSYEQQERILTPENVTFENQRRTRLELDGSLPEQNLLNLGLRSLLRYELPLDSLGSLALVPTIGYDLDMTEGISGTGWRRSRLHVGLGIRLQPHSTEVVSIDTIITPRTLDSMVVKIPDTDILVNVLAEHENSVETIDSLYLEVVRTTTLVPLLDDIFFEEGSAKIPARYNQPAADELAEVIGTTIDGEAFDVYYSILRIVGRRMQQNPEAILTLTGCNTDVGVEKGDKTLSRNRAETIRSYLATVWSIAPERMKIVARNLPAAPSPKRTEDGRSENRRVELSSSDRRIFAPVLTHDTAIRPSRSVIYFEVRDPQKYVSWKLEARQGTRIIMHEEGMDTPPEKIPLAVASGAATLKLTDEPIRYWLTLTDRDGVSKSDDGEITVSRAETVRQGAEAYWMVVFGYNRRDLGERAEETIAKVDAWLGDRGGYLVEMVGQTDRSGNADYNRELSRDRAAAVAAPLGAASDIIRGVGNTLLEYPNDLPEGRYYSRNVKIVTRTDE